MIEVIAEIGWNHMGDMNIAKNMIEAAKDSGATYAKFQTWSVNRLKNGEWDNDGRREIYTKAELSVDDHKTLIEHCNKVGIEFLSSVFSVPDARLLRDLGIDKVKIPSFECRNKELIQFCDDNFSVVFMSTGTSKWEEIKASVKLFTKATLVLMHCVSSYPADYKKANITKLAHLKTLYSPLVRVHVGYSDHIFGVESCKVAMGYGLSAIEKHFTVDRNLPGRDNKFAILPHEMKELTEYIKIFNEMHQFHGLDYQPCEEASRTHYTGRFNKSA